MWDLNGMEYYWGILPPLVEAFTLWVTNSSSMLPFRVLNAAVGILSAYLIYKIVLHYTNERSAIISSAIAAVAWPPLVVFNTYGLTETLGIFFLLLALFYYDRRELVCGLSLGLASVCRIEYWFLALGLIGCYLVFERYATRFLSGLAGWLIVMVPYIWHLGVQTGDPFYPVYWNFLGAVLGQWGPQQTLTWDTILYRALWLIVAGVSIVIILLLAKRRPNGYIVYTFFLGYLIFQGTTAALSLQAALVNVRYFLDRFMMLDYIFLAILISLLFVRLGRIKTPVFRISAQTACGVMFLGLCIFAYTSFIPLYTGQGEMQYFHQMAGWLVQHYKDGTILCNIPMVNYWLVQDGIDGRQIIGTIYISHENATAALEWMRSHDVSWLVLTKYSFDDSQRFYNFLSSSGEPLTFRTEYEVDMISILSVS